MSMHGRFLRQSPRFGSPRLEEAMSAPSLPHCRFPFWENFRQTWGIHVMYNKVFELKRPTASDQEHA